MAEEKQQDTPFIREQSLLGRPAALQKISANFISGKEKKCIWMAAIEYDKVIGMDVQGDLIVLKVVYSQGRYSLRGHTGILLLDRKSAQGLNLIPHEGIERNELVQWFEANKGRLEFMIVSNIKAEIAGKFKEIFEKYEKLLAEPLSKLGCLDALPSAMLNGMVQGFQGPIRRGEKFTVRNLESFIAFAWVLGFIDVKKFSHNPNRYRDLNNIAAKIYQDFFKEIALECGFPHHKIYCPTIGHMLDASHEKALDVYPIQGFPAMTIVLVRNPGMINAEGKIMKFAEVIVAR